LLQQQISSSRCRSRGEWGLCAHYTVVCYGPRDMPD
jgi:hypothetical protein